MNDSTQEKIASFSVVVPFGGFYGSVHEQAIDSAEEQMFSDSDGVSQYQSLQNIFFDHASYKRVFESYAKEYVAVLRNHLVLPSLAFEELSSPKFYNFSTDRIFATISRGDLARILRAVRGKPLAAKAKELFSSRPGFSSFYPSKPSQWPPIARWDHNHVGAVLEAYVDLAANGNRAAFEDRVSGELAGDGTIEDWLYAAADYTGQAAADLASVRRRLEEEGILTTTP